MKEYENEITLLNRLHYAVNLPVSLICDGSPVFSLPREIITASKVCEDDNLSFFSYESASEAQFVQTVAGENFIFLSLEENLFVSMGPFLVDSLPDSFITRLTRAGIVKLNQKSALTLYYRSLPVVSKQRFFYIGKLLESVFAADSASLQQNDSREMSVVFIQPDFYKQTIDYRAHQFRHSPYMMEQEISRAISSCDSQTAHRLLKEINSRPRARLAGTVLRSLKNSLICSCCFMTRAAISGGVSPDEAFTLSDTLIQRIENYTDMVSLLKFEDEMVDDFINAVERVKSNRYSHSVMQALSYIDSHLCEPISISDIAEAVFLSPNYLSGIFAHETGETIHSCIIRRRIEEASYFVRYSNDSLADIASFYQFSSQSHFVQSFKHIMGVTPGVYRHSYPHND